MRCCTCCAMRSGTGALQLLLLLPHRPFLPATLLPLPMALLLLLLPVLSVLLVCELTPALAGHLVSWVACVHEWVECIGAEACDGIIHLTSLGVGQRLQYT